LKIARGMTSFYAAHVREPVHPWATRQFLALMADQDVAVSFASALCSVLAVAATYLLGAYAFSRWVGLAAAFALAIERDVIAWSAEGWRDDGMMAMFVLAAWACLRVADRPTVLNAIVAGVVAGLAVLTRITTLTFLLPAIALIAWRGVWPTRSSRFACLRAAVIVAIVMAAVAAPYIINCWRTFGDPLYSINAHTVFYRARAGLSFDRPMTVGSYLGMRWHQDPAELLWTGLQGLTTYPFDIKWVGFDYWKRGIGTPLMWLSMIGLALGLLTRNGRFLAILLLASLVPYAFTWRIQGGGEWRFTMHAYPIYLFAAALAIERLVAFGIHRRWGALVGRGAANPGTMTPRAHG
jgi:4-amino-4-deoxy-L-arabinose transferase-like glycosyltransferase